MKVPSIQHALSIQLQCIHERGNIILKLAITPFDTIASQLLGDLADTEHRLPAGRIENEGWGFDPSSPC